MSHSKKQIYLFTPCTAQQLKHTICKYCIRKKFLIHPSVIQCNLDNKGPCSLHCCPSLSLIMVWVMYLHKTCPAVTREITYPSWFHKKNNSLPSQKITQTDCHMLFCQLCQEIRASRTESVFSKLYLCYVNILSQLGSSLHLLCIGN